MLNHSPKLHISLPGLQFSSEPNYIHNFRTNRSTTPTYTDATTVHFLYDVTRLTCSSLDAAICSTYRFEYSSWKPQPFQNRHERLCCIIRHICGCVSPMGLQLSYSKQQSGAVDTFICKNKHSYFDFCQDTSLSKETRIY